MSADDRTDDSMTHGAPHLSSWIGRSEEQEDLVTAAPLAGLAATLDHVHPPWRPGELPPLAHWLHFLPRALQRDIAQDGHPTRGTFLPPVPLPRRMWAGSTLRFAAPLRIGETIHRVSTIAEVQHKNGRSGDLVFVKVIHEVSGPNGLAVREEQDLVYTEAPPDLAREVPVNTGSRDPLRRSAIDLPAPEWTRSIQPDSVLLFRFSALTFNGHRIHFDRDYCRDREGYPGLVVHGPLTATLLMDLFLRHHPGAQVSAFRFRGKRPAYDTGALTLCGAARGAAASLWALDGEGEVVMTAELETS